jgi:porin
MKVSNIDARDEFRLFEAWVQQSAFDGRCSVRAGILAADQEFLLSDHSGLFLSGTFGMPVLVSANVPAPVYPVGAPGVRIAAEPVDGLTARFAVYDGQPGAEHFNETGLRLRFQDEEGLLAVGELEGRWASGCVKAGFFRHSARFFDHSGNESRNGHHGLYVAADQELAEGLGAFIRLGGTPDDRSLIGFYLDAGVVWTGFLPGRDEDALGLAAAWAELSGDFVDAQADPPAWDREILIELTWRIVLAKWFHVLPDYQYLRHPGGTSATDDAHVVGVRVDLYF